MVAVVKVFVKFVWCIGYKWWTVDTYQSYVTDKQSKHSVEIMDSQDQEVHDERKEPQEEDNADNTKKGKNEFLKSLVETCWLTLKSRAPRHDRGGRGWRCRRPQGWLGHHQSVCQVQTKNTGCWRQIEWRRHFSDHTGAYRGRKS